MPTLDDDPELFSDWFARHARGSLNHEATMQLRELVERVVARSKRGKLNIEIVVEPGGGLGRTVTIAGRIEAKPPQPEPERGLFYVGQVGTLHRDDPTRPPLPGMEAPVNQGAKKGVEGEQPDEQ